MKLVAATFAVSFIVSAASVELARAQGDGAFYKGKQIRLIIPSGPGGGYDVYGRAFARHFSRHIPGNPAIVSQNMPGAGGLLATNHIYNRADRDGTILMNAFNTMTLEPLLGGAGVQYDTQKLTWLGSMGKQDSLCVTWHTSKTKTLDDAKRIETTVASTGVTGNRATVPLIFNQALGTKFKVITAMIPFRHSLRSNVAKSTEFVDSLIRQFRRQCHTGRPKRKSTS